MCGYKSNMPCALGVVNNSGRVVVCLFHKLAIRGKKIVAEYVMYQAGDVVDHLISGLVLTVEKEAKFDLQKTNESDRKLDCIYFDQATKLLKRIKVHAGATTKRTVNPKLLDYRFDNYENSFPLDYKGSLGKKVFLPSSVETSYPYTVYTTNPSVFLLEVLASDLVVLCYDEQAQEEVVFTVNKKCFIADGD